MNPFLDGALCASSVVAAACFWRGWRDTRDRLLAYFGLAFGLLAVQWAALALSGPQVDAQSRVYVIRLAAFVLLLVGIIDKNRADRRPR